MVSNCRPTLGWKLKWLLETAGMDRRYWMRRLYRIMERIRALLGTLPTARMLQQQSVYHQIRALILCRIWKF